MPLELIYPHKLGNSLNRIFPIIICVLILQYIFFTITVPKINDRAYIKDTHGVFQNECRLLRYFNDVPCSLNFKKH